MFDVKLRPILPTDYVGLYRAEVGTEWRLAGTTPSLATYVDEILFANILSQYLVCDSTTGEPVGHVLAYAPDLMNRTAKVAVASLRETSFSGRVIVGLILFIDHLFSSFDLDHVRFDVDEISLDNFRSAVGRFVLCEGRLSEHTFRDQSFRDSYVLCVSRAGWTTTIQELRDRYDLF